MKMNKKKVFVAAIALCLIAILSMGTLAWFNATDDVTNTFKVTTDENNTDPEFTVKVSETDLDGNPTEDGVTYYDVVPGDVISKDPKVTNTGDYTQWIRVAVTMTKAAEWKQSGGSLAFTDIFSGSTYGLLADVGNAAKTWLLVEDAVTPDANGNAVWYLYLNRELPADDFELVFDKVKIDEDFTFEEANTVMGGEFNVTVKADAVQRDNTGNNAIEAFNTVGWPAGTAFVDKD